jgi:hypothetical protein
MKRELESVHVNISRQELPSPQNQKSAFTCFTTDEPAQSESTSPLSRPHQQDIHLIGLILYLA